jgi:hypothetical protein
VRNSKPMKYFRIAIILLLASLYCNEKNTEAPSSPNVTKPCSVGDSCYVITEDGLNMRKAPKLTAKVIKVVPYGTELKIEAIDPTLVSANKETGHFVKVKFQKYEGWAFDAFLSSIKPTDAAARFADKQMRAEIEQIRRMPAGDEKNAAILKLRKKLSSNLNDVGQVFLDFEVCNLGLENKYCSAEEQAYFQGSQLEFFNATKAAILSDDRAFLLKYSNCLVNVSCYFCDSFSTTHKGAAISHLLKIKNKINLKYHDIDESSVNQSNPRYVYLFDKVNGKDTQAAFFALGLVKHKKGWTIQKLGGQVMFNDKFEACQAGA